MLIDGKRALAYTTRIDEIRPIPNYDRVEHARVGGWWVIVSKKDEFKHGDLCVYFEVDSRVPDTDERFAFLEGKHYKVKTQRMCKVFSQGLIMPLSAFPEIQVADVNIDLTDKLGITYAVDEDNTRKSNGDPNAKYMSMKARHKKIFATKWAKWFMKREWGRRLMFLIFGRKKDNPKGWPVGKFPGVSKTDQERCENMTWILGNTEAWHRTQKCDGSSGTFILERLKGKNKFEFYVCSRNVRMQTPDQTCFYGDNNYYWQVALKYDIEAKMKDYLEKHPEMTFVCWQGEICGPGIQQNPHGLAEVHLFLFHMTDDTGRYDIKKAAEIWRGYDMEVVPIDEDDYFMPGEGDDNFEQFKLTADGLYDPIVCDGKKNQAREGYVYYKVSDPTFSFKNVSRKYLLKHNG